MKTIIAAFVVLFALQTCEQGEPSARSVKCDLVPETGPCKALIKRYYFDKASGKCKEFDWGGCDGVVPFETMEECTACKCEEIK